jgi:hypothetical protein
MPKLYFQMTPEEQKEHDDFDFPPEKMRPLKKGTKGTKVTKAIQKMTPPISDIIIPLENQAQAKANKAKQDIFNCEDQYIPPNIKIVDYCDKKDTRKKHFFFTFNNYQKIDHKKDIFDVLSNISEWATVNFEIGEKTNNPHLQGVFRVKDAEDGQGKRLTEIYKLFPVGLWCRACKNVPASISYCKKDKTRDTTKEPFIYGTVPDPQKISKQGKPLKNEKAEPPIQQEEIKLPPKLYNWQEEIFNKFVDTPSDERAIHWYYSPNGRVGKTTLLRYLTAKIGGRVIYINDAKDNDIFNHCFNAYQSGNLNSKSIILIDIPRVTGNRIKFELLEALKAGLLFNGKFETGQALYNPPHLIVMANQAPLMSSMSLDRWHIAKINSKLDKLEHYTLSEAIHNMYVVESERVKYYLDNMANEPDCERDLLRYLSQCDLKEESDQRLDTWEVYKNKLKQQNSKMKITF